MKRVPQLKTDVEAEAFLEQDLSSLDFKQFRPMRFEVAKNRYVIGKIDIADLYLAQNEKDAALQAYETARSQVSAARAAVEALDQVWRDNGRW